MSRPLKIELFDIVFLYSKLVVKKATEKRRIARYLLTVLPTSWSMPRIINGDYL